MRIKVLSRMAGPDGVVLPGSVLDMPATVAKDLVDGGYAILLDPEPQAQDKPTPKAESKKTTKKAVK